MNGVCRLYLDDDTQQRCSMLSGSNEVCNDLKTMIDDSRGAVKLQQQQKLGAVRRLSLFEQASLISSKLNFTT
jgi:hypothetical protein